MHTTATKIARAATTIATVAPALLLAATTSAQTSSTTPITTGVTTAVNTGAGADIMLNIGILAASAIVAVIGFIYTRRAQLGS